jgi:hypothetical protein
MTNLRIISPQRSQQACNAMQPFGSDDILVGTEARVGQCSEMWIPSLEVNYWPFIVELGSERGMINT